MKSALFKSSIAKKLWMAGTGLFLIVFLVVHATINGMIWFNDGGVTFNWWAHLMGHNVLIRSMEIVLFIGLIVHVVDGLFLYFQNRKARPVKYAKEKPAASSRWYSRSMALLGTLILLFLVLHLSHFWVTSRNIVGSLEDYPVDFEGQENLFALMVEVFQSPLVVAIYVAGCFALFWHLLHGFKSAFQTLGLNHRKYNGVIMWSGIAFSIVIPLVFAMMPISIHFGWVEGIPEILDEFNKGKMIKSITLKNFFGFKHCKINLESGENVCVGVNGSGKTNLFKAIKLLKEGVTGEGYLKRLVSWGGFDEVSNHAFAKTNPIVLSFEFNPEALSTFGFNFQTEIEYIVNFHRSASSQNYSITEKLISKTPGKKEFIYADFHNGIGYFSERNPDEGEGPRLVKYNSDSQNSAFKIISDPERWFPQFTFQKAIESLFVYRHLDVSDESPIRSTTVQLLESTLNENGDNLASVLSSLRDYQISAFDEIAKSVLMVNENFKDIRVRSEGGRISLVMQEAHLERVVTSLHVSDGTLRFLCLMAVLYNPNRGKLICIDEPELGLHPDMILTLHKAIEHASQTSQVILATHHPLLLNLFKIESIRVFEKDENNSTIVNQFTSEQFAEWKEDFLPGDLWTGGHLGGNRW